MKRRPIVIEVQVHGSGCDGHCMDKKPAPKDGPAKVNSETYIREYGRIFGGKAKEASA